MFPGEEGYFPVRKGYFGELEDLIWLIKIKNNSKLIDFYFKFCLKVEYQGLLSRQVLKIQSFKVFKF